MGKTTLLIDGNAVAYTISISNCENEKDFARSFLMKLREYAKQFTSLPKALIFFDDKSGGNWREQLYPDYQKGRKAMRDKYTEEQKDEALRRSSYIKYLKEQIEKSNHIYLHYPHTETDDLVSLYVNNIQEEGETVVILTTDKDLFQLIREKGNKKVQVLFLIKRKLVKDEKLGKTALQEKIWLGDNSDSIPGVCKNVGKTTFPQLITFLRKMKELNIDPTDKDNAKKVCESINIKYIPSFSNFDRDQLELNRKLINLNYVVELDAKENNVKTNYLKENINKALLSPFSLFSIRLT